MRAKLSLLTVGAVVAAAFLAVAQNQGPYTPTAEERAQVESKLTSLDQQIAKLRAQPTLVDDVAIYSKAAHWLLRHADEFYNRRYFTNLQLVLDRGLARAAALAAGKATWPDRRGNRLLLAYRSHVDDSLQPYWVVVPKELDTTKPARLDLVLHGRSDQMNEVSFIAGIEESTAGPTYPDRIEVNVFGRTNNAYHWAGETDVLEALAAAQSRFKVDPDRIVLRGFSMGGAGAWEIGLHYPGKWAAMEAGAGFTETKIYAKQTNLPPYQEKALHIYDAMDYSANASNLPTVGYGGEIDPQLQASVNIREQLAREGLNNLDVLFLVGPKTQHAWEPNAHRQSNAYLDEHLNKPRPPRDHIHFVTYTTRYNKVDWLTVNALEHTYDRADVDARRAADAITITTKNVASLTIDDKRPVVIDGARIAQHSGTFVKGNGKWQAGTFPVRGTLVKRHALQGPIDDAFMDRFLVVKPTGAAANADVEKAAEAGMNLFNKEFAKWMRGDPRMADDKAVTDAQIRDANLILFGDPSSNAILKRIAARLPIAWDKQNIKVGSKTYPAATHILAMIYPNPLNPDHYVVLNSGHTFHEAEFRGTNALLYPRLGDWAVLDLDGKVVDAGLFDDAWKLQ